MLRYTTDRARTGLVAFYDILPENGAGPFFTTSEPAWGQNCNVRSNMYRFLLLRLSVYLSTIKCEIWLFHLIHYSTNVCHMLTVIFHYRQDCRKAANCRY